MEVVVLLGGRAELRFGILLVGFSSDTLDLVRAPVYGTLLDGYPSEWVGLVVCCWRFCGESFRSASVLRRGGG